MPATSSSGSTGLTDLANLVLLCGEHHRALHDGVLTITALGGQRFRFSGPDGTICSPAPETGGTAVDLIEACPEVDADTITPNWDGTPLHASAIASYLTAWRHLLRRSRADAGQPAT